MVIKGAASNHVLHAGFSSTAVICDAVYPSFGDPRSYLTVRVM